MQTDTNLRPTARHQRGFTLIEIMVVIVLLGILVTMASTNIFGIFGENQEKLAQTKVKMLADSVVQYRIHYGRMPKSLEELATPDDKGFQIEKELPKDPWGNDYVLRETGRNNEYEVISFGPDKSEGTEDDISSKSKPK